MNFKRIFILLIAVLGILIIGEAIYLFIGNPLSLIKTSNSQANTSNGASITPSENSSKDSGQCQPEANFNNCQFFFPKSNPNQAFTENQLINLRVLKKGLVKSSTLNYQLEGVINKIENLGTAEEPQIRVIIEGNEGHLGSFTYKENPLLSIKRINGEEIGLLDLKIDEKIGIDVEFDMIKEQYLNVEITVL